MKRSLYVVLLLCFAVFTYAQSNSDYKVNLVVIDAGHGGHDPGTHGKTYKEKDIALKIAMKLGEYIKMNHPKVKILFTRTKDEFVPLFKRIAIANQANADLFVSIHCNSSKKKKVKGTETYVMGLHRAEENLEVAQRENEVILLENDYEDNYEGFDPNSPVGHILLSSFQDAYLNQSLEVASQIEKELQAQGYSTSRGVKQAGFAVLRRATMPSVLIETGFLSNAKEEKYLGSKKGQQEVGHSIYRALSHFLNPVIGSSTYSSKTNKVIEPVKSKNEKLFIVQFAALSKALDKDRMSKIMSIGEVQILEQGGLKKYRVVNVHGLEKAKEVKAKLVSLGFNGSFLIAQTNRL